jgi:hypothetical protein
MSGDLGNVAAGFHGNFAYGTLALSNNTYVKLVNNSINSPGSSAEAVYAESLIVPSGSTLDLNGLNLYALSDQISGTILHGSVTPVIAVVDNGGVYAASPYSAFSSNIAGVTSSVTYYSGTSATGMALSGAPTTVGTYTALANFSGGGYNGATASTTFSISPATPTLLVTDGGGTYSAAGFPAFESVAGVGNQSAAAANLESVIPSLSYFAGATSTGTPLSGAPSTIGTYTVVARFVGSLDYTSAVSSTTFTISPATPTISVIDNGGAFDGASFSATNTVAGTGSQSTASASLEGVIPSLTYYSGPVATGTPLSGAPTTVGTYTVLASFAGSADYGSASAGTTFTISQAFPTVNLTDNGGNYNGSTAYPATTTVAGVGSQSAAAASLESVTPSLTYYAGTGATGTALSGAPTSAGTYSVEASFAGSIDYTTAAASITFTVNRAGSTVSVTDLGGMYDGSAFPAAGIVAGIGTQSTPSASLEGVTPNFVYYSGAIATGSALSGVPTTAGTYTVLASFSGSTDYGSGAASTTFTIRRVAPAVSVTANGGTYGGTGIIPSAVVAGVGSQSTPAFNLESVVPSLTYYSGTAVTGTALIGGPTVVGT